MHAVTDVIVRHTKKAALWQGNCYPHRCSKAIGFGKILYKKGQNIFAHCEIEHFNGSLRRVRYFHRPRQRELVASPQ